mgnify:CR=1 FL=1
MNEELREQEPAKYANHGGSRMEVDAKHGVRGYFDVDNVTIGVRGSIWTGREIVTVDDRIVSDKRSYRRSTPHHFEHDGVQYKLVFGVGSILQGEYLLELYRNGSLIDSDRVTHVNMTDPETGKFSWRRVARKLAPYFVIGMVFGEGTAFLVDMLGGG